MYRSDGWKAETALIEAVFNTHETFEDGINEEGPPMIEFARAMRTVLESKARIELTEATEKIAASLDEIAVEAEYLFSHDLFTRVEKMTEELRHWRNRDLEHLIRDGIRMVTRERDDELDDERHAKSEKVQAARLQALALAIRENIGWDPLADMDKEDEQQPEAETKLDLPPIPRAPTARTSDVSMGTRFRNFLNRK